MLARTEHSIWGEAFSFIWGIVFLSPTEAFVHLMRKPIANPDRNVPGVATGVWKVIKVISGFPATFALKSHCVFL